MKLIGKIQKLGSRDVLLRSVGTAILPRMAPVLEVRRGDLGVARVVDVQPSRLEDGQTRFSVERFGLTANNVTYGVLGDLLRYWSFFPSAEEGWGRVPAWGFATAVESRGAGVRPGTRIFGYVPMGGEFVLTPQPTDERGLGDRSAHRAELPAVYNRYRRAEASARDDAMMVLQPLFMTSVLLARSLEGASRVILSSASSKTALGTAYLLARRGAEVTGITASVRFARSLDVYDEIVGYDAIEELERRPATFVDLAGDPGVRATVHRHLGGELRASVLVGATHTDAAAPAAEPLPGPKPTFFFAPDHVRGIDAEARAAFDELVEWSTGWLELERRDGAEAILVAWADAVAGRVSPTTGLSLAL
jgi:hypothetical protein